MKNKSDSIREYVRKFYIDPARKRGQDYVKVTAGDVHASLGLRNRVPLVCNALRSRNLLSDARVRIVADDGPPSGQSTTVAITYELLPAEDEGVRSGVTSAGRPDSRYGAFLLLRGVAKKTFEALGGGENFIRKEHERFFGQEKE